jgi:hypothetical protein
VAGWLYEPQNTGFLRIRLSAGQFQFDPLTATLRRRR